MPDCSFYYYSLVLIFDHFIWGFSKRRRANQISSTERVDYNDENNAISKLIVFSVKQPPNGSVKKGVLRNFAKLTEKQLCQKNKTHRKTLKACNFIKKETGEISKKTFPTKHFRTTVSFLSQWREWTLVFLMLDSNLWSQLKLKPQFCA